MRKCIHRFLFVNALQLAMSVTLPPLPYSYNALEPHISEKTLHFHHDKHHAKYVDTTNKLSKFCRSTPSVSLCCLKTLLCCSIVAGTALENSDLKTIIEGALFHSTTDVKLINFLAVY